MKKLVYLLLTLTMLLVSCTALAAGKLETITKRGTLLVGTTGDYKPMSYLNKETGQYEGFDYDAFCRAYAKFYTWYYSDRETYRATFESEVHPSPFVRVNLTVQMMDEFYETYPSVVEGTPMYLAPEDRLLIW